MRQSGIRSALFLLCLSIAPFLFGGSPCLAAGFHTGSLCEGCHTSHNSLAGQKMTLNMLPAGTANPYLLQGRDPSSTCLHCHENAGVTVADGYLVSTSGTNMQAGSPPVQLTPGGDFGWLKKDYAWTSGAGRLLTSTGDSHGHNIIAADCGYTMDTSHTQAPGGTFPAGKLQCISCHDPHAQYRIIEGGTESWEGTPVSDLGSYGASPTAALSVSTYRMLGGAGYNNKSNPGFTFKYKSPAAISPALYNRPESATQTRVAYGSGMSEWCANCHENMTKVNDSAALIHPAGDDVKFSTATAGNYNNYVRTGDLSGNSINSYLSLVPFETGDGNDGDGRSRMQSLAKSDDSALTGPDTTCNVSCMSCHRAQATGFDSILRWNGGGSLLTDGNGSWPDPAVNPDEAQGRSSLETKKAYYDRPSTAFSSYQRPLCNKCHIED